MGGGRYHNTFGECKVKALDGSILYSNPWTNGGAAIVGSNGHVEAEWNDGSAAAITYEYGSGRLAYFYSGGGGGANSDRILKGLIKWVARQ